MDLWKNFCTEMQMDDSVSVRVPQPLEPLRGLYISEQIKEEHIREGDCVNILAVNLNKDVFLWENAKILQIDGPKLLFSPDKSIQENVEGDILDILLERIILIQHSDEYMY